MQARAEVERQQVERERAAASAAAAAAQASSPSVSPAVGAAIGGVVTAAAATVVLPAGKKECKACKHVIGADDLFCENCGTKQ